MLNKKKKAENLGGDQGKQLCHFHFPPFPMGSTLEVKKFLLLGQKLSLKAFLERLPREANAKSQKLFPIVKMA